MEEEKKKLKKERKEKRAEIDASQLDTRAVRITYWVFQSIIILNMLISLLGIIFGKSGREKSIADFMLAAIGLILLNVPTFMQKKFGLYIPPAIYIFIIVFIWAHFILGEVGGAYKKSMVFDKILHTTSGLAIAIGGFSLVNFLNKSSSAYMKLSPLFVALFSFFFALAIAVLWEILEFACDCIIGTNMQQYLPPANLENIVGNPPAQGYGLIDTMGDVIVSTVAAAVVCVIGYITLKKKKPAFSRFLFRKITDYDTAIKEATEAGDEKLVVALEKAKAKFEKKHADCETEEENSGMEQTENAEEEKDPEQNSGGGTD